MKIINNNIAKYSLLTVFSILLFILITLLAYFGFDYKTIIGSVIYFVTTFLTLKALTSFKPFILQQLITLPILVVLIFINIIDFKSSWVSLPSNIFLLFSSYTAYFFYKVKRYIIPALFSIILLIWQYKGNKMFYKFMNYGTVNGKVYEKLTLANMYDTTGNATIIPTVSKTIILDFWNSHCGPCYNQFPFIDSINKKIDTSKYELFVVNVPLNGEKKEDNYKILDKYNYTFKKVFANDKTIMDSFKIQYFPTTIVIKGNIIVFRGDFLDALKF